jgi:hypothetical protein
MADLVAVRGPGIPSKREALMFDAVVMYHVEDVVNGLRGDEAFATQLRFLHANDVIRFAPGVIKADDDLPEMLALQESFKAIHDTEEKLGKLNAYLTNMGLDKLSKDQEQKLFNVAAPLAQDHARLRTLVDELVVRLICLNLREQTDVRPYGLLATPPQFATENSVAAAIADVVLASFPIPNEDVAWDRIIEFRSDPDARTKFLSFRRWMANAVQRDLDPKDVSDELEYLINQYKQHMELHRIKYRMGTFRTILTVTADILENVARFRLKNIVDGLFSIHDRKIQLMEAELSVPGRDVAYIVKAQEQFPERMSGIQ